MGKYIDLTGQKYNRLTVIKRVENDKHGHTMWLCQCECGNEKIIKGTLLKTGKTKSCSCLNKEITGNLRKGDKKYNKYDLSGEYGIGYTSNTNEEYYFDLEDYEKIKDYTWRKSKHGYLVTNYSPNETHKNRTVIEFHLFILNKQNRDYEVDHIDRNKLNNRRSNFRLISSQKNSFNSNIPKNNTSGYIGVSWNNKNNNWMAYIKHNYNRINLGSFNNIDDAIKTRLKAEKKYFGEEYAPQRHLFEQYMIV